MEARVGECSLRNGEAAQREKMSGLRGKDLDFNQPWSVTSQLGDLSKFCVSELLVVLLLSLSK